MRGKDANSVGHGYRRNGQTDQAVMTARQLLSILRLGQALARLRLANEIGSDDIDEALRLTKASKSSLKTIPAVCNRRTQCRLFIPS